MKKTQYVELCCLIKKNIVSFLAIVLFVAMSLTLYAGITWTIRVLHNHIDNALQEGNASDLTITSELGLTETDLKEISQIDGVSSVEPAYVSFQSIALEGESLYCGIYSLPTTINQLTVKEGTLPKSSDEIALLQNCDAFCNYQVGDTIEFEMDGDNPSVNEGMERLSRRTFTITAKVYSPSFLCNTLASLGTNDSGVQLSCVMFAPQASFAADAFHDAYPLAYVSCDNLRGLSTFEEEYQRTSVDMTTKISHVGESLSQERYQFLKDDAEKQINKAQKQIGKAEKQIELTETLMAARGIQTANNQELQDAKTDLAEKEDELAAAKKETEDIKLANWLVNDRNADYTVYVVNAICASLQSVRLILASLFIVIGLLVCYSIMSRLVHDCVQQIGTKKALGLTRAEISKPFIGYAVLACLLGTIIGATAGATFVESVIITKIDVFVLPRPECLYQISDIVPIVLLQFILICLSAWIACNSTLKRNAVELLNAQSASTAKHRFYESWKIWKKLSLLTQTMISNCFNDKRRMLGTFIGVMGCTALIVCAITFQSAVNETYSVQETDIELYDEVVFVSDGQNRQVDGITVDEVLANQNVDSIQALYQKAGITIPSGSKSIATIIVPKNNEDIQKVMDLRLSSGSGSLNEKGAYISCAYGKYYDANIGDEIALTLSNGFTYQVTILGFFEYYGGANMVIMNTDSYVDCFGEEPEFTARLVVLGSADRKEFNANITAAADCTGITDSRVTLHTISSIIANLAQVVVIVYLIISALVALFVLLNLYVMFVSEKKREIIILIINGYSLKDAKKYISRDSIIVNSLGMVAGCVLGSVMGVLAVQSMGTDLLNFIANPSVLACAIGILICALFSFIVMRIALRRIDKFSLASINE